MNTWISTPYDQLQPGGIIISAGAHRCQVVSTNPVVVKDLKPGKEETSRHTRPYRVCLKETA